MTVRGSASGLASASLWVAFALAAVSLLGSPGTSDTEKFWLRWIALIEDRGLVAGYAAAGSDYPPLSFAILAGVSATAGWLGISPFQALKLSMLAFLLATALAFWALSRRGVLTAAVALALIPSSMALVLLDVYYAPTLLLSIWALRSGRLPLFGFLFAVTCLIKWQPLLIAPFLGLYALERARGAESTRTAHLIRTATPACLVLAATFAIFRQPVLWSLSKASGNYMISGTALNLGWVLTHALQALSPDRFGPLVGGEATPITCSRSCWWALLPFKFLVAGVYGLLCLAFMRSTKTFESAVFFALAGYLAYFAFNSGVHENHLFLAVLLAAALWGMNPAHGVTFAIWAATANLNLVLFDGFNGRGLPFSRVVLLDTALPLSIVVVVLCTWFIARALREGWPLELPVLARGHPST